MNEPKNLLPHPLLGLPIFTRLFIIMALEKIFSFFLSLSRVTARLKEKMIYQVLRSGAEEFLPGHFHYFIIKGILRNGYL